MSFRAMALAAAMTALLGGGSDYGRYQRRRELTLDEEEEQSVYRMIRRAHALRLRAERHRRQAAEREAACIAAEIEAARPKSRQELRARERAVLKSSGREMPTTRYGRVIPKDKSSSLERMLAKAKRH